MNIESQQTIKFKANLFRGVEGVGGTLHLLDDRVRFEPHSFNIQREPVDILYTDILVTGTRNTLWLIPNGFYIKTKSGKKYKFVVWQRRKIVDLISAKF